MSVTNGKVTAPVSIADIQQVLGVNSGDLGTLCRSDKINMWAKFKPVPNTMPTYMEQWDASNSRWKTEDELGNTTPWWKGRNGNYGLSFANAIVSVSLGSHNTAAAFEDLALKIDGNANGWAMESLGSADWARMTDFAGYRPQSSLPFSGISASDISATTSSEYTVFLSMRQWADTDISQRDYILPDDISQYTLHMGFVIYKKTENVYNAIAWVTDTEWRGMGIAIDNQSDGIKYYGDSYVESKLKEGETYYILPFYASEELLQGSANSSRNVSSASARLFTIPYTDFASFHVFRRYTSQTIGEPKLSNLKIRNNQYSTSVYIDSTPVGYNGGTATIDIVIAEEGWEGGSYMDPKVLYHNYWSHVTIGADENKLVGATDVISIDPSKEYDAIVEVGGEKTYFSLSKGVQPIEY